MKLLFLFVCFSKTLGLLGNQFLVIEVIDAHGVTHLGQSLGTYFTRSFCTLSQNLIYSWYVLFPFLTADTHWLQTVIQNVQQQFLTGSIAQTATCVVLFQLIQVLVIRQELLKVAILGKCIQIGKYGITLQMTRLFDMDMLRVGIHGIYLFLQFLWRITQVDAVAQTLTHLSLSVDTWGVDYALIDQGGTILQNPYHYRDDRTLGMPEKVAKILPPKEFYELTGLQDMNFNTGYQLLAHKERHPALYELADKFILMPDLFGYLLTGRVYAETSMASTTQLLDPYTKQWQEEVIQRLGLKRSLFPELVPSGTVIGDIRKEVCDELSITPKPFIAVGGHDTSSAVAAVPAQTDRFVYISCGTWSLFGTELKDPCITPESQALNIPNETGYGPTTRFLKNIMGLWMIQETRRQFRRDGKEYSYAKMEELAAAETPEVFEVAAFCQAFLDRIDAAELKPLGLYVAEGVLEYDDAAKLMPLVARLRAGL